MTTREDAELAEPLKAGDPMRDFALPSLDGSMCDSRSARTEKLLLFAFWKRTCGTCQFTFPYLQRFQVMYGGAGFRIWGIAQESADDAQAFMRQYGATFTQVLDSDYRVSEEFGLVSVPAIYLVDSSERILRAASGFDSSELNAMARVAAERTGTAYSAVVRPEDGAPDFKPG